MTLSTCKKNERENEVKNKVRILVLRLSFCCHSFSNRRSWPVIWQHKLPDPLHLCYTVVQHKLQHYFTATPTWVRATQAARSPSLGLVQHKLQQYFTVTPTCVSATQAATVRGWEFAHRFLQRFASFLWAKQWKSSQKEQNAPIGLLAWETSANRSQLLFCKEWWERMSKRANERKSEFLTQFTECLTIDSHLC